MKKIYTLLVCMTSVFLMNAQIFTRTELPTPLTTPWEILYGPDDYLWVSDSAGRVSRINPTNGSRQVVYTAPDYFPGSPLEQWPLCFEPTIGAGTMGLALHPDFMDDATSFIYVMYSYNSGTAPDPATRFKIKRLQWDANSTTVINTTDVVTNISTGYDHLGGRLMAIERNNIPYLFVSVGDHGISEMNNPDCYDPQSENPNNFAQDPNSDNGKIHRYNIDGSIPDDNPIAGNSFYTRGHRNPQGLMYNNDLDILYDIEHGDRTDDEINVLHAGMNYGWKDVRGYHMDNNFPGEAMYILNYVPDANITNDALMGPLYSWCAVVPDGSDEYLDWCTVAPSGGIYYNSPGIPEWTNSLLVVTLKDGLNTDQQLYQFKLQADGQLMPSTVDNPNPKKFFGGDQAINGRLRDIAVSPDGTKIYLVNNFGAAEDKITVYTYESTPIAVSENSSNDILNFYPNPVKEFLTITSTDQVKQVRVYDSLGAEALTYSEANITTLNVSVLPEGVYLLKLLTVSGGEVTRYFVKQ